MKWPTGWYVFAITVINGCTVAPRVTTISVDEYVNKLTSGCRMATFKGWGDVEVAIADVDYNGSIDVLATFDSVVTVNVYSPFGTEVITIQSEAGKGTITLPDFSIYIENQDRMSGLPFKWAETLSFDEFLKLLTSRFNHFSLLLQTQPDSSFSRKTVSFSWKDSCAELSLTINRHNGRIKEISCKPDRYSDMFVSFYDFSGPISRRIKFYSDDGNYFIIKYEKIDVEYK